MDRAILRGVQNYIRNNFEHWNKDNCKAMPDGRPDPMMGRTFCSIHITEAQGATDDQGILREVYGFGVTVTKRIEAVPYDRITDSIYLSHMDGISSLVDQINYSISNRYEVANAIASELPTAYSDPELFKFVECFTIPNPPILVSRNPRLRFRDEEWFHGSHDKPLRDQKDGHVGVSFTLNYGKLTLLINQTEGNC